MLTQGRWWYKFTFAGQVIRESSHSDSKTIAKDAERTRRREMEQAINRIPKREKTPLFGPGQSEIPEPQGPDFPGTHSGIEGEQ